MASALKHFALNLTAAGTEQQFTATLTLAQTVILNAPIGNTGIIYVGNSGVSVTDAAIVLNAGETLVISMPEHSGGNTDTDLSTWYFDGGTTNDDLLVGYLQRTN